MFDPALSGGTFDAAGDFDRWLDATALPVLGTVDPYADTPMSSREMPGLLRDVQTALCGAKDGPERRGLLRLQTLARRCLDDESLSLLIIGD